MRRMMTIVALMCAIVFPMSAQESVEELLKQAEKKVKLADKHPKNGKLQIRAAEALANDSLGDKKDYDRALIYLGRALQIAKEKPAPQDTLMGLACYGLSLVHLKKGNIENACDYMEMAIEGFEKELGRNDPLTIGSKVVFAAWMMGLRPIPSFIAIQEAFMDNSLAPQDKRIQNLGEATIIQEFAFELLLAEYYKHYQYCVPMVFSEGKKYLIVQTKDWNMEKSLVGWMLPQSLRSEEENEAFEGDPAIIFDLEGQTFMYLSDEEKEKYQLTFNFIHKIRNPRYLESKEGDSRIWFMTKENHEKLLNAYREFKAQQQK